MEFGREIALGSGHPDEVEMSRSALANPLFDDEEDDVSVPAPKVATGAPKRRGRPSKANTAMDAAMSTIAPSSDKHRPLTIIHRWICPVGHKKHPYLHGDETGPLHCEDCNTVLIRHHWAVR